MAVIAVIVDANQIVKRDWRLQSPWWSALRGLAATGQVNLVVPEIVVREVVGRFAADVSGPARDLGKLGISLDPSSEVDQYDAHLRNTLAKCDATVPDHDPTTILALADRAIRRVPPFNDQGNGFRDAVVWSYVLELVCSGRSVIFLSDDSGFCQGRGDARTLHADLVEEAGEANLISWYPNIGAYLESTGRDKGIDTIEARVLELFSTERAQLDANLTAAIVQSVAIVYGIEDVVATVVEVRRPTELLRVSVVPQPLGEERFVATIDLAASIVVDVDIEQSWDGDSTLHRGVELSATRLEVEAFYDTGTGELSGFSAGLVELEWERIENALSRAGRRPPNRRGTGHSLIDGTGSLIDPSQADSIRRIVAGFDSGQADSIRRIVAGFDFGQADSIRRIVAGFDSGQLDSIRRIASDFDVVRRAAEGFDFGQFDAIRRASGEIDSDQPQEASDEDLENGEET